MCGKMCDCVCDRGCDINICHELSVVSILVCRSTLYFDVRRDNLPVFHNFSSVTLRRYAERKPAFELCRLNFIIKGDKVVARRVRLGSFSSFISFSYSSIYFFFYFIFFVRWHRVDILYCQDM